ncbi:hypothetical protein GCM10009773_19870 [Williamsia serinedens]
MVVLRLTLDMSLLEVGQPGAHRLWWRLRGWLAVSRGDGTGPSLLTAARSNILAIREGCGSWDALGRMNTDGVHGLR